MRLCANKAALVFAPHQDDETLGCGGTIIRKRDVDTPVTCVFMTDGSASHGRFIAAGKLRCIRRQEAIAAAAVLGIEEKDLCFLDFKDGHLAKFHDDAVKRAREILRRVAPEEVYVPYRADGTPDHEATFRIVTEALRQENLAPELKEYPVWFWNRWPWVKPSLRLDRGSVGAFWRSLRCGAGLPLWTRFREKVFVGDVLTRKRLALAQHRSQMEELLPGVSWPTLAQVSEGQFLRCFFQDYEVFSITRAG